MKLIALILLLLPSIAYAQKVDYGECYVKDNITPGVWTITTPKRPKCGLRFNCYKRHAKPKRVDNIVWYQMRGGRLGATWGTVGWAKTVVAASNETITTALKFAEGIEPGDLGSIEEQNTSLNAHWGLVNELHCEHDVWCRERQSEREAACMLDWYKLPKRRSVYNGVTHTSLGETIKKGMR
jgi:hypothetical protein